MKGSFHEAIGPVLFVAQFFGLMPVDGVKSREISSLCFRWKSMKTIYSLTFVIFGSVECLLCLRLLFHRGMTLAYCSSLTFYTISVLGAIYFIKLASKWKHLMKVWYDCEKVFLRAPYKMHGLSLKRTIILWSVAYGFFASCKLLNLFSFQRQCKKICFSVDHALFLIRSFYNNQQIIEYCNVNESEFFHSYLIAYRYHLTSVIPYHIIEYPLYEWINILMTFSWSFVDLIIVLISVALAKRFNQVNNRLIENRENANSNEYFWTQIRLNYYSLVDLVEQVDEEVSVLILISTGHNLFSLCVVIFESLTR